MFGYTKGIIGNTIDSIKKIAYGLDVITQITYMGYLIFAISVGNGVFWANLAMLGVSVIYFIYFLSTTKRWYTKKEKGKRKKAKLLSRTLKRLINIGVIVSAIIELCIDPSSVNNITLLLTVLMILGLTLSITFDLIIAVISARLKLIYAAIETDVENIKKPFVATTNFVKKVVGKDVQEHQIDQDTLEKLNMIKEEQQEIKKEKKIWSKENKMKDKISIK